MQGKLNTPTSLLIADRGAKVIYPYIGTYHLLMGRKNGWGAPPYIGVVVIMPKIPQAFFEVW